MPGGWRTPARDAGNPVSRMFDTETQRRREKAILVGLEHEGVDKWELKESLDELAELAS